MNHVYQLVWNTRHQAWVAVSEVASRLGGCSTRSGKRPRVGTGQPGTAPATLAALATAVAALCAGGGLLVPMNAAAQAIAPTALPQGGVVAQGAATLQSAGTANAPVLNINQSSQRAAINWNSFNLGSAGTVNFNQPNAQSATLNRVLDMNPTQILGRINAPGQVTIINPAGVYFSPGAVLDVGALTATTLGQTDADFMAGKANFSRNGATGSVVNAGSINARDYIALLAPEVRNEGSLTVATAGTVVMAGGEAVQLNFDAFSRLASITVTPSQIATLVENKTAVLAPGGLIILSARALSGLQASVINSGQIDASSMTAQGGRIVLEGDNITLANGSSLNASGATGGGTVLVGGDWQGAAGTYQATTVAMASDASIDASATQSGDGGKVVLWSDVGNANSSTTVNGSISAQGIAVGGQVETSGHTVVLETAQINAGGLGSAGLWLIDPYDYTIGSVPAGIISGVLSSGTSVTVSTSVNAPLQGSSGSSTDNGSIAVNANISKTGGVDATLTLRAAWNITLASNVVISSTTNKLNVLFNSDLDGNGAGAILLNNNSRITTNGGNVTFGGGTAGDASGFAVGSGGTNVAGVNTPTPTPGGDYPYVTYSVYRNGVDLNGATVDAGGGNITMRGKGGSASAAASGQSGISLGVQYKATVSTGTNGVINMVGIGGTAIQTTTNVGIALFNNSTITSGAGTTLNGTGGTSADNGNVGILVRGAQVNGGSGLLTLVGTGGTATTTGRANVSGVLVDAAGVVSGGAGGVDVLGNGVTAPTSAVNNEFGVLVTGSNSKITSTGGDVVVTGTGGTNIGAVNSGVVLTLGGGITNTGSGNTTVKGTANTGAGPYNVGVDVNGGSITSNSGVVTVTGIPGATAGTTNFGVAVRAAGQIATTSGSVVITTDSYSGDGTETVSAGTAGQVTVQNRTAGRLINLGGADVLTSPLTLGLTDAEIDHITAGTLVVGRNDAGTMTVSSAITPALATSLTLKTNAGIAINAPITLGGSSSILTLTAAGNVSQVDAGNLSAANLLLNGAGSYALATSSSNAVGTLAAIGTGALSYKDSNELTIGTIGTVAPVSGINANGAVSIGTASRDLTVAQNVASADTGTAAIVLNAGVSAAAGTGAGGNIIISGGSISTGGRATLYTGTVAGSTGLSTLVGSGNFRYSSDEDVGGTHYTTALGNTGTYAIYRETPAVTVTANNATKTYDGIAYSGGNGYTVSGLANGDTLGGTAAYSGTSQGAKNVAGSPYTITVSGLSSGLGYNTINYTNGTLTINPYVVSITGNRSYDGSTNVAAGIFTPGTLVGSETLTLSGTGTVTSKNVGNGKTVTLGSLALGNGSGLASNYTLSGGTATANITPALLSVSGITATDKTYDGTNAATVNTGGAIYTGLVSGETLSTSASGLFSDKNAATSKTVTLSGTTSATGSTLLSNYTVTEQASTTATIEKALLTVKGITAADKPYDGTTAATVNTGNLVYDGLLSGETLSTSATGTFADKNVATGQTVTLSGTTSATGSTLLSNYTVIEQASTTADITKATLIVSGITAANKVYDGTTSATVNTATAVYDGLASGETLSTSATGSFGDKNAATGKTVTLSGITSATGSTLLSNYTVTEQASTTATISKAAVTVTAPKVTKTYDGTTNAPSTFTSTVAPLAGAGAGETVSSTGTLAYTNKDGGINNKTVQASGLVIKDSGNVDVTGNYNVSYTDNTASTITQAVLTVIAVDAARFVTQSDTANFQGIMSTGYVNGESAASAGALTGTPTVTRTDAGTNVAAGTYSGTLVPSGMSSSNYSISYVNGTFTIVPAGQLLITVPATTNTYGSAPVYGTPVAQYLNGANVITTLGAPTVVGNQYTYNDGAGGTAVFTLDPVVTGSTPAPISTAGQTRVGAYNIGSTNISATSANFSNIINFQGSQTVTTKGVTASALGVTKPYDGTTTMAGATVGLSGNLTGDLLSASGTGAFADKNVGNSVGYTVSGVALDGADKDNYYLTGGNSFTGTDGVITPAALTLSTTNVIKPYDGTTSAAGALSVTSGFIFAGDSMSGGAFAFTDKNASVGDKAVSVSGATVGDGTNNGNYNITYANNTTSTINKLTLTVSGITASDKNYDGTTAATVNTASAVYSGLLSGETLSTSALGTFADKNVATGQTVTLSGTTSATGSTLLSNYTVTEQASTTASINKATLTVRGITASNKTYDGTTSATVNTASAVYDGLASGETLSTSASGSFGDKNAATGKTVTLSGTTSATGSTLLSNYTVTEQASTTADISKAAVTVTAPKVTKTYDGTTNATGTSTVDPLAGAGAGETVSSTGTLTFTNKDAGTDNKTVQASGLVIKDSGNVDVTGNYTVSYTDNTASTINQAVLTVTAVDASRFVTQSDTANFNGVMSTGYVTNESAASAGALSGTATVTRTNAGINVAAGTYSGTLVPSGLSSSNYSITYVNGNFEVIPAGQLRITVPNISTVYGTTANYGTPVAEYLNGANVITTLAAPTVVGNQYTYSDGAGGTAVFTLDPVVTGSTAAPTSTAGLTRVGAYNIGSTNVSTTSANFSNTVSFQGSQSVTTKGVTASANGVTKPYDGTTSMAGATVAVTVKEAGDLLGASGTGAFDSKNAGSNLGYSVSGLALTGADKDNYYLAGGTSLTGSNGVITPAALTLSSSDVSKPYDGTTSASGILTVTDGTVFAGDSVSGGSFAFTNKNASVGDKVVSVSGATVSDGNNGGNYVVSYANNTTSTINKATLNVTAPTISKTYDGTVNATGSAAVGALAGAGAGEVIDTAAMLAFTDKNAGMNNKTVVASGLTIKDSGNADVTGNYTITYTADTASTINKAGLTVTANDDARFIGKADGTNFQGAQYLGFLGADDSSVLGGALAVSRTGVGTNEAAGSYAGTLVPTGLTASNYDITYANGTFTVVPANQLLVKVSGSSIYGSTASYSVASAEYLDSDGATIRTLTGSGTGNSFSYSDGLGGSVGFVLNPNSATTSTAGNVVKGTFALGDANPSIVGGNFTALHIVGNLVVAAKPLSASATGVNKQYDGNANVTNGTLALATVETNDVVTVGGTGTYTDKNVGTTGYTFNSVVISGTDAANYYLAAGSGGGGSFTGNNGTITQAPITLSTSDVTKTYDGSTSAVGTTVITSGFLFGGDTLSGGSYAFTDKNVATGTKTVTTSGVTISDTNGGGNYLVSYANNTTSTINKATLTVTAPTVTKTYDRTTTATGNATMDTLAGAAAGETVGTAATLAYTNKDASIGDKTVTASGLTIKDSGNADVTGNYTITYVDDTVSTINRAALTVSGITADHKTYDGNTSAVVTTSALTGASGLIAGDDVSVSATGKFGDKDVANGKTVTLTSSYGGADQANYAITDQATTTASITPRTLVVTADNQSKVYDKQIFSGYTATLSGNGTAGSGFAMGESLADLGGSLAYGGGAATAVNAGNHAIQVSGLSATNYSLSYVDGTLQITQAALTLSSGNVSKAYDGGTSALGTATVTSGTLFGGDSLSGGTFTFTDKNAGTGKTVTASGITVADGNGGGNYLVTYADNTASSISQANLVLTTSAVSKDYDGTTTALGTVAVSSGTLFSGDSLSGGTFAFVDKNAGTGKAVTTSDVTVGDGVNNSNYAVTYVNNTTSSIAPAAVSVTAPEVSKTYDGTTDATGNAAIGSLAGAAAGDRVAVAPTVRYTDKNAGVANKTTRATGMTILDGNGVDVTANYTVTYVDNTTSTISGAALTVTANADARFVTQADTVGYYGAHFDGLVGGETSAVLGGTLAITRANAATDVAAGSYIGVLQPSGLSSANYSISYQNGNYSIVPASKLLVRVQNTTTTYGTSPALNITSVQYLDPDNVTIHTLVGNGTGNSFGYSDGAGGGIQFTLNPVGATTSTAGKTNVGNYALADAAPTLTGPNLSGPVVFVGNLSVEQKSVSAIAAGVRKTYNGSTDMVGISLGLVGLEAGDGVLVNGNGAFAQKHAGSNRQYLVRDVALSGPDAGNYYLVGGNSLAGNDGTITPAAITVTTGDVTKPYDGNTDAAGIAVLAAGQLFDSDALTGGSFAFDNKNVGTGKTVTPSGFSVADGNGGGNYTVSYVANTNSSITPVDDGAPVAVPSIGLPTQSVVAKLLEPALPAIGGVPPVVSATAPANTSLVSPVNGAAPVGGSSTGASATGNTGTASQGVDGNREAAAKGFVIITPVRDVTPEVSGLVQVQVSSLALRTGAFDAPLPERIALPLRALRSAAVATRVNGDPLPVWLRFDPQSLTFTARAVPGNALPLTVLVRAAAYRVEVEITELP